MSDSKLGFKDVFCAWWRFFWRYAAIFVLLLLLGGYGINFLKDSFFSTTVLFWGSILYGLGINILVSLFVFWMILGKKVGRSSTVLLPAAVKRNNPEVTEHKISLGRALWTWWGYFWRFALFAFAIGFTLGALIPQVENICGIDSSIMGKYTKYLGNFAVIPASLLVFIVLMWRKEKRRKLDIVRIEVAP